MKINFNHPIFNLDGTEFLEERGNVMTLKSMTCRVLSLLFSDETNLPGEERSRRGNLAMRIYADPDTDLTVEELSLIKSLIGKGFHPLIVAQAWDIIEGKKS